jgi:hypothetical protein
MSKAKMTSKRAPGYGGPTSSSTTESHESFGIVGINRVSSTPRRLFGSHQEAHTTMFEFTVSHAERVHGECHSDSYYARKRIVQFSVSSAQFVEMMTSLNMNDGVPCTLEWLDGERMGKVPEEHRTESQLIADNFREETEKITETVKPMVDAIQTILDKKSIGKADRKEIASQLNFITRIYGDHAPFVMDQFTRSADRKLSAGKAELDAMATSFLMAAGMAHLKELQARGVSIEDVAQMIDTTSKAIEGGSK